jgi:serine/threonine protein kinase
MHLGQYQEIQPRRQLSIAAIQSVARHSLSGLDYLHGNGITHRDLKPENILVGGDDPITGVPIIKLADFGLSSQRPELETFCGTLHYIAPEMHGTNRLNEALRHEHRRAGSPPPRNLHSYTPAVDIWAMGMVLHKLLGGEFQQQVDGCWYPEERDLNGAKRPPARLVAKMLTIDPGQRPTAATCLQDPWLATGNHIPGQPQEKRVRSFSPPTRNEAQPRKKAQSAIPHTQTGYSDAEISSAPQTSLNSSDDVTPLGTVRQVEGLIQA